MGRKKATTLKMRADNQSICIENLANGKIMRVKRWRAWQLVDDKKYKFASNAQWRAQNKKPAPKKKENPELDS